MKRICSSDSLNGLMSICPTLAGTISILRKSNAGSPTRTPRIRSTLYYLVFVHLLSLFSCRHCLTGEHIEGNNTNSHMYDSSEFQTMLADDEEEPSYVSEKKRRLSVNQVKALEKNFEVENKLEPDRKVKLAQELGLQPRQVAVWFQNRRARWKTKQLERDYGLLKANFDALKRNYQSLQLDNQSLNTEILELKSKLQDDVNKVSENSSDDREMEQIGSKTESESPPPLDFNDDDDDEDDEMITECENDESTKALNFNNKHNFGLMGTSILADHFKDGSSDSDSSALLNFSPKMSSDERGSRQFVMSNSSLLQSSSSSGSKAAVLDAAHKSYLSQFVKIEEHDFFRGDDDESCSTFFADDQPPTLPWDCPGEWI